MSVQGCSGDGHWTEAPHLSEEVYNLKDALVVAQMDERIPSAGPVRAEDRVSGKIVNVICRVTTREACSNTRILSGHAVWPMASGNSLDVAVKAPLVEPANSVKCRSWIASSQIWNWKQRGV